MPTVSELNRKIANLVENLAEQTDQARASQQMQNYFSFCARFHRYSLNNLFLILLHNPQATRVAGYNAWLRLGRHVRKGEHGIPILAPCPIKKKTTASDGAESEQTLMLFKVVYVFDESQTEGADLPEPPTWHNPEHNPELHARLIQFAQANHITVEIAPLTGQTQGLSTGGKIILAPTAGTKTLIHELAHELLHKAPDDRHQLTRQEREIEAEATAHVVYRSLGLTDETAQNYLATWCNDSRQIMAHLERIRLAASQILTAIELQPTPEPDPA